MLSYIILIPETKPSAELTKPRQAKDKVVNAYAIYTRQALLNINPIARRAYYPLLALKSSQSYRLSHPAVHRPWVHLQRGFHVHQL